MVVWIDGKGFTEFSKIHNFSKPNDIWALELMNRAGEEVMKHFKMEILLGYG